MLCPNSSRATYNLKLCVIANVSFKALGDGCLSPITKSFEVCLLKVADSAHFDLLFVHCRQGVNNCAVLKLSHAIPIL